MAGEPESLSEAEGLARHTARHHFDRLIMLSDGVFAIAITLLALELPVPEEWNGQLGSLLDTAGRALVGYLFAFVLVGAIWVSHRALMARIVRVDMVVTVLTLVLLGLVGLTPYVSRLIAEEGPTRAIPVYLLALGSIQFVRAVIGAYAARAGLLHEEVDRAAWTRQYLSGAAAFLVLVALGTFGLTTGQAISASQLSLVALVLGTVAAIGRRQRKAARRARLG